MGGGEESRHRAILHPRIFHPLYFIEVPMNPLPQPFKTAKRRVPRKRRAPGATPPGPATLTLIAATYDTGTLTLSLTFDRAVNIDALDGAAITVDDPVFHEASYPGDGGAVLVTPDTVEIALGLPLAPTGTVQTLTATAANGIVAVDDGGTWPGVVEVALPFP
jgi:hypothetical protein